MAYVITQGCCNDASCVPTCPVQCIRPRPGDPDFTHTEQLYIDPKACIDCGACMDACPVEAIYPDYEVPDHYSDYVDLNAEYFDAHPLSKADVPGYTRRVLPDGHDSLRVAVVGSGPAGMYATGLLSEIPGVTVSVFDRLPTPFGLIRTGVAPDHVRTKSIAERFGAYLDRRTVSCFFNVEVGRDITLPELLDHHHAVIWAGGAGADRELGVPGERLAGVWSARDFVAWYNGHPEFAERSFTVRGDRAVVVGNGNVALDVARTLLLGPDVLGRTDISDTALEALSRSGIREVDIVARRGPEHAAYSLSELLALSKLDGIALRADPGEVAAAPDHGRRHEILLRAARDAGRHADRVIRLRFGLEPVSIDGGDQVRSITFRRTDGSLETIPTSAVFRAIGYRGAEVEGLPFDPVTATVPHDGGRVVEPSSDESVPGLYCSGWIKRGPRGIIGTNKADAAETVDSILQDLADDRLSAPEHDPAALAGILAARGVDVVDKSGWHRIDAAEKSRGTGQGRPRKKFIALSELLRAAHDGT
ncbi:putative ferredoxin/ferredoxin--NADP reductase [Amycolatopsis deserti]|uniref:Ferredoxin/ferredoxin--NADP reductase n=1 Tax=Amycolatopsis deserti TaxID=185696 RepID=A0ABQ3ITD6_9PSEU|nr:4Fe-4S binding protein [Amycolatopsis deserti]GHE88746.1 putative ferredoxin/ferredoxin--NADP reductase [Amycolatopsis deserti]